MEFAVNSETELNYSSRRKRGAFLLGSVAVGALLYLGQQGLPESIMPSNNPKDDTKYAELVEANEVFVSEGARVRYSPIIPGSEEPDNIGGVIEENLTIDTPSGIRVVNNHNKWIGIQTVDIKASLPVNKSLLEAAEKDRGGTVWISTQRAEANFDYTPEPTDPATLVNNG
jgi:hypothetical protein